MNKLEQAARQLLSVLENGMIDINAVTALREALAHSGEANETGFEKVKLNPEYDLGIGRGSMTLNRWVDDGKLGITGVKHDWDKIFTPIEQRQAEHALQKLSDFHQSIEHDGHWSDCSTHNEPAYPNGECDCGGYPAEQEPVGRWNWNEAKFEWLTKFDYYKRHMTPLYAAPVRTKDLTDDEIWKLYGITGLGKGMALRFARAVIAADREKNK